MNVKDVQSLNCYLVEFKNFTLQLINSLEQDNYEQLEELFNKRQVIIDKIDDSNIDKKTIKEIIKKLDILPLQQKLLILMNQKKSSLKAQMNEISSKKSANQNYGKKFSVDSIYFNKKI